LDHRYAQLPGPSPSAVFKALDEGGVLFSTDTEVYFGVNAIGAQIWELLGRVAALEDLCRILASRYSDVPESRIRQDVVRFLDDLLENGLAVPRATGASGGAPVSGSSA
jgi:hypothetical protein